MQPQSSIRPKVSIVIPCRNEADHIERCISSILAQEQPDGGFEIIVADGMSDDGTREVVEGMIARLRSTGLQTTDHRTTDHGTTDPRTEGNGQWSVVSRPPVRLIDNPGRICSTGLNAAIRTAQGEIIIRMDAHTEYAADYIVRCVKTLEETGADNVGGPWIAKGNGYVSRAIAAAFQSPFAVGGARSHALNHEGPVDSVYLGCWRRGTFERFGYFDEELVRNQDDEHNLRIIRGGGKIWQSTKIKSWYRPRGSF